MKKNEISVGHIWAMEIKTQRLSRIKLATVLTSQQVSNLKVPDFL